MNPLLDFSDLPDFALVKPEHVGAAFDSMVAEARSAVAEVASPGAPAGWEETCERISDATERLGRVWRAVEHVNAVADTPEFRKAYNENVTKTPEFMTEMGQNLGLFAKYKEIAAAPAFRAWKAGRRKVVENAIRDFRLSGAELGDGERRRFAEIEKRLSEIDAKFAQNDLDATDAYKLYVEDQKELEGIPEDVLAMYAEAAKADGKAGWKLTLQMPSYLPAMQYGANRALRERLYEAYVKTASEFGPAELDNTPLIRERLKLIAEKARLLGYANFAAVSLSTKMAADPRKAIEFLRDLAARAKPYARRDRAELEAFARAELGLGSLEAWDIPFASEKLRVARYSFSANEVKRYFPEPEVLGGLFALIGKLYGVEFVPGTKPVWHPDARYFDVLRGGGKIAGCYIDLYAREGKRSGAWMSDARVRRLRSGELRLPVAFVNCNFSRPSGGKPALFRHDEVETLFHEFGHALHLMLTEVDEIDVAGINGVEWDAVELPSQIMENFCWEWSIVEGMSRHADTGERLPKALFDRMLAAKNFLSGMQFVRQLEFGLFDLILHSDFDAEKGDWLALLDEVRKEVAVNFPPSYNRFPNGFGHIFGGGYTAGYYSYKWAEVLSADAYSAFEESGGANPATGGKFLAEVLSVGGSRPAAESFRAFRGRDPDIEALLRHSGLSEALASC